MELTRGRTVRLWNDGVNHDETKRLIQEIEILLENDPNALITLEVYSSGGNCAAGFGFCDWVIANKVPLQTVGYGVVESMAVPIFLLGSKRYIGQNTTVFLHPMTQTYDHRATFTEGEIEANLNTLKGCQEAYIAFLLKRLNVKKKYIRAWIVAGTRFNAKEALTLGFAHEIVGTL